MTGTLADGGSHRRAVMLKTGLLVADGQPDRAACCHAVAWDWRLGLRASSSSPGAGVRPRRRAARPGHPRRPGAGARPWTCASRGCPTVRDRAVRAGAGRGPADRPPPRPRRSARRRATDVRVLVVVPAFNEEESLPATLAEIRARAPGVDVLVVDDGSSDGTRPRPAPPACRCCALPVNLGVGAALQTGFRYALERGLRRRGPARRRRPARPGRPAGAARAAGSRGVRICSIGSRLRRGREPCTMRRFLRRVGMLLFSALATAVTRAPAQATRPRASAPTIGRVMALCRTTSRRTSRTRRCSSRLARAGLRARGGPGVHAAAHARAVVLHLDALALLPVQDPARVAGAAMLRRPPQRAEAAS